ncbi:MAG: PEP-CTERM sorting domain-containing protein [Acidobacteriia bacterium]|nr:PEP-CTERM sorting domain-containing protein [Terriglobia bacterium]
MRWELQGATLLALGMMLVPSARASVIYNNLTPTNLMAMASRPDSGGGVFEIESADDFVLGSPASIFSASFTGLIVPAPQGSPTSVSQVVVEIYRVFPLDSDTVRTPNVPTRANSPSDVAFDSRDSAASGLSFSTSTLNVNFTALNSVQPGGIHPAPNQATLGNGPVTGQEVRFDVSFATPFDLQDGHYFFIPQVLLSNGGQFYWLSASRPISGAGTTPFSPDLQAWTRDADLDPDWLRVGTDIVGPAANGNPAPTFNAAFSLEGTVVPEPSSIVLMIGGLALIGARKYRESR